MNDAPSTESRLVVTARMRRVTRLDDVVLEPPPPDPSIADLQARARDAAGTLWLAGGEPTLRQDLPTLVEAVANETLGLCTDGLALASSSAVAPLRRAGLSRVRIQLHAARPDAHDWLVRQAGAARRAIKALRACAAEGLAVEIEAVVTRSTMPYLAELCELGAHVSAGALHLRRLVARGGAAESFVGLAPQQSLLEPYLEEAARTAARRGVQLALHGFTHCGARSLEDSLVPVGHVRWLIPTAPAWQPMVKALTEPEPAGRCPTCPGSPSCPGAAADYVAAFGWQEFLGEHEHEHEIVRIAFGAPARVACPDCASGGHRDTPEPSRAIRQRMIRAARRGTKVLRVASAASLAHPQAAALLRETRFLRFARVEVAAEASALDEWTDDELRGLDCLARLDMALYGPDAPRHDDHVGRRGAFDAALRGLRRFGELTGVPTGAFAVLHDTTGLADYARAWADERLPGTPTFRLSPGGGSLDELAAQARRLRAGPTRTALSAVLPPCLLARDESVAPLASAGVALDHDIDDSVPPSGSDRFGEFLPCVCDSPLRDACPGLAVGWSSSVAPPGR